MTKKVYIVDGARTPIGKFGGSLKGYSAVSLGTLLIRQIVKRNSLANITIDGVILGNVLQAGLGQNPARQCTIGAGLSCKTSCLTVNKVCGSGLKAIDIAYRNILAGYGDIYIVGGIESMSNSPYLLKNARWGHRLGNDVAADEMVCDGLWCPYSNMHMGKLVDSMAKKYKISRKKQDEFSVDSHYKATKAIKEKRFTDEIVPVDIIDKKGNIVSKFCDDEHPRKDSTVEKLSCLKPAFSRDGTITAGNASGISDGAAVLIVVSDKKVKELNLNAVAEIISISEVGVKPELFGISPIEATEEALSRANLGISDIELAEFNEAFAAQTIYVLDRLKIKKEIVNVNGGAVALGHPIGASGARIAVTLIYEMVRRQNRLGLASICIGSGEGMAIIVKII